MQPDIERDLCSPSQLDLRYRCPGSVRLQLSMVSSGKSAESPEAAEGTKKHDLCLEYFMKPGRPAEMPDDALWILERAHEIALLYAEVEGTLFLKEYQIDLSDLGILGGKEGCRIDLLIVIPGRKAVIVDYKFGVHYVPPPKYNWQMKGYAVGVFRSFGVSEIEVIILQPNIDEKYQQRSGFFYAEDISEFEKSIREIVERTKAISAPLVRGEHCVWGFCKARGICSQWRDVFLSLPIHTTIAAHIKNISPAERATLYENIKAAAAWCNTARDTIEAIAVNEGLEFEGYEIGTGRKTRTWAKPDEEVEAALKRLFEICKSGFPIYEIVSPGEVEKILGKSKKVKEIINPLIMYVEGKPCLKKKASEE